MNDIPYYEKIHNDYLEGKISKKELLEMCEKDKVLKEWIYHHQMLRTILKGSKINEKT